MVSARNLETSRDLDRLPARRTDKQDPDNFSDVVYVRRNASQITESTEGGRLSPEGQTHVGKSMMFSRLAHGYHELPLTWPQVTPRLHGGVNLPVHNSPLISIRWWDKRPFFATPLWHPCVGG